MLQCARNIHKHALLHIWDLLMDDVSLISRFNIFSDLCFVEIVQLSVCEISAIWKVLVWWCWFPCFKTNVSDCYWLGEWCEYLKGALIQSLFETLIDNRKATVALTICVLKLYVIPTNYVWQCGFQVPIRKKKARNLFHIAIIPPISFYSWAFIICNLICTEKKTEKENGCRITWKLHQSEKITSVCDHIAYETEWSITRRIALKWPK